MTGSARQIDPPTRPHKPKRLGCLWNLTIFAAVLIVGVIAYQSAMSARVARALDSIRAAGEPASVAELNAWLPGSPDDGTTAGSALARVAGMIVEPPAGSMERFPLWGSFEEPPDGAHWSSSVTTEVIAFLDANATTIEAARKAAKLPAVRLPVDPGGPLEAIVPSGLSSMRKVSNLLRLDAELAAERGDADHAVESLLDTWRVGEALSHEPSVIGVLVEVAIRANAIAGIRRVVQMNPSMTEAQLMRLIEGTELGDRGPNWRRAWIGERIFALAWYDELMAKPQPYLDPFGNDAWRSAKVIAYKAAALDDHERLDTMSTLADAMATATLPLPDRLDALGKVGATHPARWWYVINSDTGPMYHRATQIEARMIASHRAMRAAIAVMIHTKRTEAPPATLADLSTDLRPWIELDPFTGDPLYYAVSPDRIAVYSTGDDKTDNGGERLNSAGLEYEPGADIVFEVRRGATTGGGGDNIGDGDEPLTPSGRLEM